eukprot:SAG11_NODE_27_length_23309_cov_10.579362_15_plen_95_part_00
MNEMASAEAGQYELIVPVIDTALGVRPWPKNIRKDAPDAFRVDIIDQAVAHGVLRDSCRKLVIDPAVGARQTPSDAKHSWLVALAAASSLSTSK